MPDLLTVLIFPLIVVVIGLGIEYWVIQPLRNRQKPDLQKQQIGQLPTSSKLIVKPTNFGVIALALIVVVASLVVISSSINGRSDESIYPTPTITTDGTSIYIGSSYSGTVANGEVKDYTLKAASTNIVEITVSPVSSFFDPAVEVFDSKGGLIYTQDSGRGGENEFFRLALEQGKDYWIRVRGAGSGIGGSLVISLANAE